MSRRNPENAFLLFLLDQGFGRTGWHGPTLSSAVRDVSAKEALWRPSPGRHSIWELVLHAAFWKHAVRQRLTGARSRFVRSPANWPHVPEKPNATAWSADVALLTSEHAQLVRMVERFPAAKLHRKIPGTRFVPMEQLVGIAAHDLYHTGQISLIRRMRTRK